MTSRRPTAFEFTLLLFFHAAISGAFLVAYLTGDEDTYGMHAVAGYTALVALALRLAAAVVAPRGTPLAWPRPRIAALSDNMTRLMRGERRARLERSPLYAWMAVVVMAAVGLAAASGAAADFLPRIEKLHEALGEIALYVVIGHVGLVLVLYTLRRTASRPAESGRNVGAAPSLRVLRWIMPAALVIAALGTAAAAPSRDAILASYAAQARQAAPAFAGFSAERGRALYMGPHTGGKAETNACAVCHTADPAAPGRHNRTGRAIKPMAVAANVARFTDMAEVEKRFARDCKNVLGRDCTAQEKGDFITFLSTP